MLGVIVFFTAALGVYGFLNFQSLKNSILINNESQKAAILQYGENTSNVDPSQFKALGDGRFTMVMVGIDKAAGLTDSIQIFSFDTVNKKANFTSIPRDLYVTVPGHGRNKINTVYKFAEADKPGSGSTAVKTMVGNILGTQIDNFALINFTGLKDLVDAVGGIQINVTRAISDPLFPAETGDGFSPFYIGTGLHTMDGATALKYARSRETTSDFDRARRQQEVIDAIRQKTLSLGVLTNPVKLNNIITALGKNFKTDLDIDQIHSLYSLYSKVSDTNRSNNVIDTSTDLNLLTSSSDTPAGYISYPILGFDKYTAIQRWYRNNNPDPLLAKESPSISVIGSGKATDKQLTDYVAQLNDFGFRATLGHSVSGIKSTTSLLYSNDASNFPITANYLKSFLKTDIVNDTVGVQSDFTIVYVPTAVTATPTPKATVKPTPTPTANPDATPDPSATDLQP